MNIGDKPFIIAEMSGNHGGDLANALSMITAAKQCGCDAIKIQTYEPEDLCDPANNEIYQKSKIPGNWYSALFERAQQVGIPLFSSVFAPWAVEFLEQFDCPAYKIASPESTRLSPFVYTLTRTAIGKTKKTFMASSGRTDMLVTQLLCPDVLFYCKAGYPATIDASDLEYVSNLSGEKIGFSDHTHDLISTVAMIGAGAQVIEKHFKLDDNCIDAAFSFNPSQMEALCRIAHR